MQSNNSLNHYPMCQLVQSDKVYFTTIKKLDTYYIRMMLRTSDANQSVTVSLRTNKRITAMTNMLMLKEHLIEVSGTFKDFTHMRTYLKELAKHKLVSPNRIKHDWFSTEYSESLKEVTELKHVVVPVTPSNTIETLIEGYIKDKLSNAEWSEYTAKVKSSALRTIPKLFSGVGLHTKPIELLTREDLIKVRDVLVTTLKISTINARMRDFKSLFRFAELNNYIVKSVANKLDIKDKTKKLSKDLSNDTISSIIKYAATGHRNRRKAANHREYNEYLHWFIQLGAITGARLNEIAQLRKDDIKQTDNGNWFISINDTQEGNALKNTASNRCIPLIDGAHGFNLEVFITEVVSTCETGNFIFRLDSVNDRERFTAAVNQVFVKFKKLNPNDAPDNASMHSLRHSVATLCMKAKIPEAWTQRLLGHTQSLTYGIYAKGGIEIDIMHSEFSQVFI